MNVWRATYDSRFSSSSSDGGPYHIDKQGVVDLVLTVGDSLHDVEKAIQDSMDSQTHLTCLRQAEWLGKAIGERL